MNASVSLVVAVLAYTMFAICSSRAGGRIDASLGSVIFNGVAAVVCLAVYLGRVYLTDTLPLPTRASGLGYSIVAGVSVGAFSILLIAIYGRGGHLSYVYPVIYGASIALGTVVGFLILGDPVSLLRIVGVAAIVGGLALLVMA